MYKIIPHLYLSDKNTAVDYFDNPRSVTVYQSPNKIKTSKKSIDFEYVVNLCDPVPPYQSVLKKRKIDFYSKTIEETYDGAQQFYKTTAPKVAEKINKTIEKKENVLVHCRFGQNRSVSQIIFYLMKYKGYTYEAALKKIQERKEDAHPTAPFEMVLNPPTSRKRTYYKD